MSRKTRKEKGEEEGCSIPPRLDSGVENEKREGESKGVVQPI